ncbi:MAG: extracellular solute-binding protein [Spirochaetia bacterium]|jgi:raffinose/stachyose/melibiose transport system substrate-binding protein
MMRKLSLILAVLIIPAMVAFAAGQTEPGQKAILKVWDQWTEEGAQTGAAQAITMIEKSFMEKHPNVTVERTPMQVEEMTNTLKPAIAAGRGPDVFYSEVGIGFVGPIIQAGYIMDLTKVAKERGWIEKLYPISLELPSINGMIYGVGHELEFVPVYYNKNIFKALGLPAQPKSIAEFEDVCQKLKAAGYIPMAWGGKDWWYQSNFTTEVLWSFVDKKKIEDGMYRDGSWSLPEVRNAIETAFVKWAKNGFFIPNPTAIGSNEVNMEFIQQKAAMHITGSWDIDTYVKNVKDFEVGTMLFPPARAGKPFNTISFVGSGYLINAKTKVPKAAVDYVDYVCADPDTARIWVEVGNKVPPFKNLPAGTKMNPMLQETLNTLLMDASETTPGLAMTVPPEVMSFLQKSASMVLTGQITSDQWVDEFQQLWDKSKAEGLTRGSFKVSQ